MTTPPGWYPDPGPKADGSAGERWWDGSAWTEHTRPAAIAGAAAAPTPATPPTAPPPAPAPTAPPPGPGFGPPGVPTQAGGGPAHPQPGFGPAQPPGPPGPGGFVPPPPPGGGRSRTSLVLGIVGGLALVVALVLVGLLVFGGDDSDGSDQASDRPSGSPSTQSSDGPAPESSAPSPENTPTDEGTGTAIPDPGSAVTDPLTGVSMPLLEGWKNLGSGPGGTGMGVSEYPCPADSSLNCLHGGASVHPTQELTATDPEGMAKEDVSQHAQTAYNADAYGGITSRQLLKSEAVTVAGQEGYRVRWKVVNTDKPDAYVESVVIPAPASPTGFVVFRFGFDIHEEAPPLAAIDEILEGVRLGESDKPRDPNEV